MSKKSIILLISIFILGLSIRLIGLGTVPDGFTPDEASQGYSAYSLLKTGHDEWGASWPLLSFKSFLDYKSPLQTYLMIPSIAVFGLNQFAVRLPSAIFGSLAIFAIYLLANELFRSKIQDLRSNVGLVAAATLALTPWSIQFSRMALEANLISFFFPLGLWAFLKGLRIHNTNYYLLTSGMWGLSLYAYHSVKLFLPLFCLGLLIICRDRLRSIPLRSLLFPLFFFALLSTPVYIGAVFGHTSARGGDLLVTNFSDKELIAISDSQFYSPLNKLSPVLPRILSNRISYALDKFTENYISYLTPNFWFTNGGSETTYAIIPNSGLLNLWQVPFIVLAIYFLIYRHREHPLVTKVLFLWLFLSPLPAAITKEGFRPNRASMFLGFWALLTAYGIFIAVRESGFVSKTIHYFLIPIIFVSFIFWFNDFAFLAPIRFNGYMSEGWRDTISALQPIQANYAKVYIERGSQSQAFIAFYSGISPQIFQRNSAEWDSQLSMDQSIKYLDQLGEYSLSQFTFKHFSWPENIDTNTLYIAKSFDLLPQSRHSIYQYHTKTGQKLFEIFDFRK